MFFTTDLALSTNEIGVDLSDFQYIDVALTAPKTWSLRQLTEWLTGCLGLNTETHTVGVHALWTRSSTNIFFYLRPVQRDSQWVRWLEGCEKRGCHPVALVLPVLKDVSGPEGYPYESGQSSHVEGEGGYDPGHSSEGIHISESGQSSHIEGGNADGNESGEVDADEVEGHMQNQMEDEDRDCDSSQTDDSEESDEEENAEEVLILHHGTRASHLQ